MKNLSSHRVITTFPAWGGSSHFGLQLGIFLIWTICFIDSKSVSQSKTLSVLLWIAFWITLFCGAVGLGWLLFKQKFQTPSSSVQPDVMVLDNFPTLVWRSSHNAQRYYCNRAWLTFTGRSLHQEQGKGWLEGVHPDDQTFCDNTYHHAFQNRQPFEIEYRLRRFDGEYRWILDIGTPFWDQNRNFTGYMGCCYDITARKQLEELLRSQASQERLLGKITQNIHQSLDLDQILDTTVLEVQRIYQADRALIFQLHVDGSGQVIKEAVNLEYPVTNQFRWQDECFPPECYEHYRQGNPRIVPDVETDEWAECLAEFMQAAGVKSKIVAPITQHVENTTKVWGLLIIHACSHHRQWHPAEAELLQQISNQLAIAIQQSQLYQQLQIVNQTLQHQAMIDGLTHVANRRRFDDYLNQEWLRHTREGKPLALILCDVDYFKQYNDTYGHLAGDECLVKVAETLKYVTKRSADLVARYGGEEFAVILPNTDCGGAEQVAKAISAAIRQLKIHHETSLVSSYVTVSLGVASLVPTSGCTPHNLIRFADQALYQAKVQGRDRYWLPSWRSCDINHS